jgi:cardiolipin synthase
MFTHLTWEVELKGRLGPLPKPHADYGLEIIDLKYDRSPAPAPEQEDDWQPVRVVSGETWEQLVRRVADRLTPTDDGKGVYFRTTAGEGVLHRDAEGVVKLGEVDPLPDGVELSRRYGIHEFAAVFAKEFEAATLEHGLADELVCLVIPTNNGQYRFALVDRKERRAILCAPPRSKKVANGGLARATGVVALTEFVVESHVWAILKNPVSSAGRLGDKLGNFVGNLFSRRLSSKTPAVPPVNTTSGGMNLAAWESWLNLHTDTRQELGSVRFLVDGQEFFPVFKEKLQAARTNIHLLVCIFDVDDVAVGIADILRERSADIDVAVILDRFSSKSCAQSWPVSSMPDGFIPPKSITSYLQRGSNVRVRPYLNTWGSAEHSKVYLIDGTHAYIGGMNLGREYRYEWHDLMSEIEGPIVASLEWEFSKAWAHASALGDLAFASRASFGKRSYQFTEREDWVLLRRLNTRTTQKAIRKALLEGLRRAEREVFLENPYLFSNEVIIGLAKARLRGVDVRVILGTLNNMIGGSGSNIAVANHLLRNGVRVFLYPGMSHIKAAYIDGWVTWGSANFSGLSLKNNLEVNLGSSDATVAAELRERLFEEDFQTATELTEPLKATWSDALSQSLLNQL